MGTAERIVHSALPIGQPVVSIREISQWNTPRVSEHARRSNRHLERGLRPGRRRRLSQASLRDHLSGKIPPLVWPTTPAIIGCDLRCTSHRTIGRKSGPSFVGELPIIHRLDDFYLSDAVFRPTRMFLRIDQEPCSQAICLLSSDEGTRLAPMLRRTGLIRIMASRTAKNAPSGKTLRLGEAGESSCSIAARADSPPSSARAWAPSLPESRARAESRRPMPAAPSAGALPTSGTLPRVLPTPCLYSRRLCSNSSTSRLLSVVLPVPKFGDRVGDPLRSGPNQMIKVGHKARDLSPPGTLPLGHLSCNPWPPPGCSRQTSTVENLQPELTRMQARQQV